MTVGLIATGPNPETTVPLALQRRGRHRDRALAAWRRSRAIELKVSGRTYQEIAYELGYANRGTVHHIVRHALEAREAEGVDILRTLELDRLDSLNLALWDDAVAGDVAAAQAIIRIIDARCRLLGLHEQPSQTGAASGSPRCQEPVSVVLQADDCRHAGCCVHGRFFETAG